MSFDLGVGRGVWFRWGGDAGEVNVRDVLDSGSCVIVGRMALLVMGLIE